MDDQKAAKTKLKSNKRVPRKGAFFCFMIAHKYNKDMNTNTQSNCNACGRPFPKATQNCNWSCGPTSEYCGCSLGRIKKDADPCKACCVIPSVTVESVDGITNLANCFVHATDINTTFYVDDKHRPMITWSGDVEVDLPADVQTGDDWNAYINSFKLRSQHLLIRFKNNDNLPKWIIEIFYFDRTGKIYWAGEYEEVTEE